MKIAILLKRICSFALTIILLSACRFPSSERPSASAAATTGEASISLEKLTPSVTYDRPVGLEKRAGEPDKLYVVEQAGRIRMLNLGRPAASDASVVLDITDRVRDDGNEQGLLGLAFHPDKPNEAYLNYTTATHTVISRFTVFPDAPDRLDPDSEKVILTFRQPHANHNGGQLAFGPDGMLYIGTGDGGGAGDPEGNGQNKHSLLGKILRIDVDRPQGSAAYSAPADNPFANGGGAPEVYAYGLRNPWRFSFDSETGVLWAADVGQDKLEEIDRIVKGGNYGWNIREGNDCYRPVEGCASIWGLKENNAGKAENRVLLQSHLLITSFGVDAAGELFIVAQDGGIYRIRRGQGGEKSD